jgi:hypothetical protein
MTQPSVTTTTTVPEVPFDPSWYTPPTTAWSGDGPAPLVPSAIPSGLTPTRPLVPQVIPSGLTPTTTTPTTEPRKPFCFKAWNLAQIPDGKLVCGWRP